MSHQLLEEAFRHHLPQLPAAHIESSLTLREFYLARLFEKQLTTIYRYLADRELATQFRDNEFERSVQYVYAPDPRFIIKGKIDRIQSYTDEQHRYVVVMDYKTSNKDVNHERLQKGLDLQLVFYLHLLEHDATFGDFEVAGFYYQPLNLGTIKRPRNELNDPIPNLIKLQGVTLNNVHLFQAYTGGLDSVRNVKVTKKQEFNTNAKKRLQEPTWFDQLLKDINHHIEHAIEVIQHGDYRINPQPVNKKAKVSPSCEYCSFSSVCYLANSIVTPDEDEDDTDDGTEDLDNG
jgi:ATP-dependent helicase/DNAse subunit B